VADASKPTGTTSRSRHLIGLGTPQFADSDVDELSRFCPLDNVVDLAEGPDTALPERATIPTEPFAAGEPALSVVCSALCAPWRQSFGDGLGDIWSTVDGLERRLYAYKVMGRDPQLDRLRPPVM
jgi:hypothetical protein